MNIVNIWNNFRYGFLPYLKVRTIFLWWSVRYGGSNNIPREIIAARMEKNIEHTRESLLNARRALPEDATKEDREMLLKTISEHDEIERIYREQNKDGM